MRKLMLLIVSIILSSILIGCNENKVAYDYYFFYALTSNNPSPDSEYKVITSNEDLLCELEVLEIEYEVYPEINFLSFENYSLIIYYFNDYFYSIDRIEYNQELLTISTIKTTNEVLEGKQVLFINVKNEYINTENSIEFVSRDSVGTDGETNFEYNVYDSLNNEVGVNQNIKNRIEIINDIVSYNNYIQNYSDIVPYNLISYDSEYFYDKTLVIWNCTFNNYYSYFYIDIIEIHSGIVNLEISLPVVAGRTGTFYSVWIEIPKNENIIDMEYNINFD